MQQFGPLAREHLRRRYSAADRPEILTAKENQARHYAVDLSDAAANLHGILATRQFVHDRDYDDLLNATRTALIAAVALIDLLGADPDELLASYLGTPRVAPRAVPGFRLSTVLSVLTGKVIASPSEITNLLGYFHDGPVDLGTEVSREAGRRAGEALFAQHPQLCDPALPAMPATADDDTVDQERPEQLAGWVAKVARFIGQDSDDPWLPVSRHE